MLSVPKIALDDRDELWIAEETTDSPVEERREARDHRRYDHSAAAHDPARLGKCAHALLAVGQVIQRAEEEDGVDTLVRVRLKVARISHVGSEMRIGQGSERSRLLDVKRHHVQ